MFYEFYKGSHWKLSIKKYVLKNSHSKTLVLEFLFNEAAGLQTCITGITGITGVTEFSPKLRSSQ